VEASQGGSKLEKVERLSKNNKARVEELYATHAQGAVRLAYLLVGDQEIAQYIAQEAFIRAFGRFADMRKPSSFPNYLKATIVNLAQAFKRRGLERLYVERLPARPAQSVAPHNVEQREMVVQALLKIPERQRAALVFTTTRTCPNIRRRPTRCFRPSGEIPRCMTPSEPMSSLRRPRPIRRRPPGTVRGPE
jgi:DNA-directed RNA polymerase specialized sigma24 family protein